MRPVDMGYCTMEGLKNGVLDLEDVALMNDAIDARLENERRITSRIKR